MAKSKEMFERSMWHDLFEQDEFLYNLHVDEEYWYNRSKTIPTNDKHEEVQPSEAN